MFSHYLQTRYQINATKNPKMYRNNVSLVLLKNTNTSNITLNSLRYAQNMVKSKKRAIIKAEVGFILNERLGDSSLG